MLDRRLAQIVEQLLNTASACSGVQVLFVGVRLAGVAYATRADISRVALIGSFRTLQSADRFPSRGRTRSFSQK